MLLNAEIVFDRLPSSLHAVIGGKCVHEPHLQRPKLYESGDVLASDHLYVMGGEMLGRRLGVGAGVTVVCIGDTPLLDWYEERCCIIRVNDSADFASTFNAVQRIFDELEEWDGTLESILSGEAGVQALLDASRSVFGENPLLVTDSEFNFLGTSGISSLGRHIGPEPETDGLSAPQVGSYLAEHDLANMRKMGAFTLETLGLETLCVNLIDKDDYLGCLTVSYEKGPHHAGDDALAEHLASALVRALRILSLKPNESEMIARQGVKALINQRPLGAHERTELQAAPPGPYLCLRLRLGKRLERMPGSFVCGVIEKAFAQGTAFVYHDSSIVAVLKLGEEQAAAPREAIRNVLAQLAVTGWQAGISDVFNSLIDARAYFLEASTALNLGSETNPIERVHEFQRYALPQMLANAMGDLPPELMGSPGLRALIEHDKTAQISYVETLRAYLNNNMSASATASALFVHRSTLIERLSRIRRILDEDLDDPDTRLRLMLVLRGMQENSPSKSRA